MPMFFITIIQLNTQRAHMRTGLYGQNRHAYVHVQTCKVTLHWRGDICIYIKTERCYRNMLSLIIVALSIRKVDLRVDEVQGVINQVDLSGRSMKGWSGTPEASHSRVNEAEGDPAPDVVQGATVRLAILLWNETYDSLEGHSSWGPPTTVRKQD